MATKNDVWWPTSGVRTVIDASGETKASAIDLIRCDLGLSSPRSAWARVRPLLGKECFTLLSTGSVVSPFCNQEQWEKMKACIKPGSEMKATKKTAPPKEKKKLISEHRIERDARIAEDFIDRAKEMQNRAGIVRNRATAVVLAKDAIFRDQLALALERALHGRQVVVNKYVPKTRKEVSRVLNVLWSDLHFGAALDPREVPLAYGHVEEARRFAEVVRQIAEYKRDHRDSTVLAINIAGDIIQNNLHDARDGAPLAEQFAAALHLLTQGVAFLSSEFREVTVRVTPGNHGRNKDRHKERAVQQKWDSIEDMLYYSLGKSLSHLKNVKFEQTYRPYFVYENFGMRTFVTHGDTVLKPGFPGSSIDVGGLRKQINELNAAREPNEKITLFCVGHVHTGSFVTLPNGAKFLSNGALIPVDAYAQSIGNHSSACCQAMWESVPGKLVGDLRFVEVDHNTDLDKSLDKIISPFKGF